MFTLKINLNAALDFQYGQKLYVVEPDPTLNCNRNRVTFSEKCPVCDNTRKIQYRGFELKCTYCDRVGVNYICIEKYTVSGIKSELPVIKNIRMFTRWGRGFSDCKTKEINMRNVDPKDERLVAEHRSVDFVFTSKEAAAHALELLIENDKKRLNEFNKEHGTEYKYPF